MPSAHTEPEAVRVFPRGHEPAARPGKGFAPVLSVGPIDVYGYSAVEVWLRLHERGEVVAVRCSACTSARQPLESLAPVPELAPDGRTLIPWERVQTVVDVVGAPDLVFPGLPVVGRWLRVDLELAEGTWEGSAFEVLVRRIGE